MERVNVFTYDTDGPPEWAGYFYPDKCRKLVEDTEWNGHDHVGVISGSNFIKEYLYRTAGGRWVHRRDESSYNNGDDMYEFYTDGRARDWLLRSQCNDAAIEEFFGDLEEEQGPPVGGRPAIGPAFSVKFPPALTDAVDAVAKAAGLSRSEQIRRYCEAGLAAARGDNAAAASAR